MIVKSRFKERELTFILQRHSDFSAFYQVLVEKSYSHLMDNLTSGDTVVDAGANIGIFTVLASTLVGDSGRVLAIEPDPENLANLKRNIESNNLHNVEIVNRALYKKSGEKVKFFQSGVMSKVITSEVKNYSAYIDVETITLDDLISQTRLRPSVLKMDIEGSEKFALLGAQATFGSLNYFEAEIHSKEDWDVLQRYTENFSLKTESIESMRNVLSFSIRRPWMTFKLECYNRFRTTKRVVFSRTKPVSSEYPIIVFGMRFRKEEVE
jgi:FkbM family methyltransferase